MSIAENETDRLQLIVEKSNTKQIVGLNTLNTFNLLKEALKELSAEYTAILAGSVNHSADNRQ